MKRATFTNRLQMTVGQACSMGLMVCFAAVAILLVSCAPAENSKVSKVDNYTHLDADEREALANLYADEGEQKLGFATLNEAWGKFSEALRVDPKNERAEFWREMLKPLLEMKGIAARVRPLYLSKEGGLDRYTRLMKNLESNSSAEYRRYQLDGPADIATDAHFREWMDRTVVSLDTARSFIKANKDRTYSLRAPVNFIAGSKVGLDTGGRCTALRLMNSKFSGCVESGMLRFKVNRADLEVLQYVISAQMLQLAVLYAYNLNPIGLLDDKDGLKPQEIIASLTKGYDGGLFERNRLSLANSVAPDWLAAQQYFIQNQNELCKNGQYAEENRPGFLISSGLCLDTAPGKDARNTMRMLEMTLLGQPVEVNQSELAEPISIHPLKFFNHPPKDALGLAPTVYDESGEPVGFNDTIYSPYFAQGSMTMLAKAKRVEDIRLHNEAVERQTKLSAQQREYEVQQEKIKAEREKAESDRMKAEQEKR